MRPATPLSVLFFAGSALLLLSSLSTPVLKAITLGSCNGVDFGVWGFCKGSACSSIGIGYSLDALNKVSGSDFTLPPSTRRSLSFVLIAHPVAAFLGLVCFGLALAAHFHSPSHSPRFLLGLFILTIPTMLASLLAFLVDVLLFIPHVSFGGWIVLAATIILFVSSVITCFMRRTLVSRKSRRQRIAENAEMNGQNYYENKQTDVHSLPRADSPPPLSGESMAPLNPEKPTGFASFESADDRVPLNQTIQRDGPLGNDYGPAGPGMPPPRRDQYGNPLPPDAVVRQQQSNTSLRSTPPNRSGPSPVYPNRGRGGYPLGPPGRGGYPPRGGMMRGGMPPQGMRGPTPPGYGGQARGGPMIMGRGGAPPPGYGRPDQFYNGPPPRGQPYGGPVPRSNPMTEQIPIGSAFELDAAHGLPSPSQSRPGSAGPSPIHDEMPRMAGSLAPRSGGAALASSPTSDYSGQDQYVPPRAQWAQPNQRNFETPPLRNNRALSPIEGSPTHMVAPGGGYVEDVDPAFAAPTQPLPSSLMAGAAPNTIGQSPSGATLPGPNLQIPPNPTMTKFLNPTETTLADPNNPSASALQYSNSSDSLGDGGQRSPATSETSHYTSVSQRGVNPNWRPPPQPYGARAPDHHPAARHRQNDLLNANPDFMLPGAGPRRGGGGGGPRGGVGSVRGGAPPSRGGGGPLGARYPGAF